MSAVLATMTAGIGKITMKDVTTIAHTNTGMRLSDIPGARILNAVTMISTATAIADTSVNVSGGSNMQQIVGSSLPLVRLVRSRAMRVLGPALAAGIAAAGAGCGAPEEGGGAAEGDPAPVARAVAALVDHLEVPAVYDNAEKQLVWGQTYVALTVPEPHRIFR